MQSINFPIGSRFDFASAGSLVWNLGPLVPGVHFVRGLSVFWRLKAGYTAAEFLDVCVVASQDKLTLSTQFDSQRALISGAISLGHRLDAVMRSASIPLNHVPRNGSEVYLSLNLLDNTASGMDGFFAFDVTDARFVPILGGKGKGGLDGRAGGPGGFLTPGQV